MSEERRDELTGRRVLLAEGRAERPNEFARPTPTAADTDDKPRPGCAFCPGNEAQTPRPSLVRPGGPDGWRVRIVPNRYPAVDAAAGQGVHEVVIESPRHVERTGLLDERQYARVLLAIAQRMKALAADGRYPYRLLFKNVGASAGASLQHLHSQLIALPAAPAAVVGEQAAAFAAGCCRWCERLAAVRLDGRCVVADAGRWLAWCPAASRQPYEVTVAPTGHESHFERLADDRSAAAPLARLLLTVLRAVEQQVAPNGYNMMVHTSPGPIDERARWHWRIEIVPRVASLAGLELATGLFLNAVSPERAAERLRRRIGPVSRARTGP